MLARARDKQPAITWEWANAQDLPYESDRFAAATVGFGARNFSDLRAAASPRWRAWCGPGGRVVILEITTPQKPPLVDVLPRVVRSRRARAGAAGRRLRCLHVPAQLREALPRPRGPRRASWPAPGLRDIRWILTAGGIIAIHVGTKA